MRPRWSGCAERFRRCRLVTFRIAAVWCLLVLAPGCGGEEGGPTSPGNAVPGGCPEGASSQGNVVFPGDRYDYEEIAPGTDPRDHAVFAALWEAIRVQSGLECWQQQGATNNLQFFENPAFGPGPRYRFVGTLDTEVGALFVHSVGCYVATNGQAYRAAAISTYSGQLELLVLVSAGAIDHFIGFQGDVPLITRYIATPANCL